MKTKVFFVLVFIASGLFAQNSRIISKPTVVNLKERMIKKIVPDERSSFKHEIKYPMGLKNQKKGGNSQIAVVTVQRFSGSMNVYGVLSSEQKALQYNSNIDVVTFTHRKSQYFTTAPANTSGDIVVSWSLNRGTTWDSSCVWSDGTNLGRYPQGGIYNPPGNTNVNNIHFVATGPITDVTGTQWTGNFYASKSYTDAAGGNPTALGTPTTQYVPSFYTSTSVPVVFVNKYYTYTDDGFVRAIGIYYDTTGAYLGVTPKLRGAGIMRGSFNAGSFTWSLDSLIYAPLVTSNSSGSPNFDYLPVMAWDNSGTIGYVVMLGQKVGMGGTPKNGVQPLVYKTTNSGASWTLVPDFDFTVFNEVIKRLPLTTASYTYTIPYFSSSEGIDATVDAMGRLHLVCTLLSHYTDHTDSVFYTYSFNSGGGCGSQNYVYYYGSTFTHPVIFDFILENNNTWGGIVVDSIATESAIGNSNTCSQWATAGLDVNARIQVSRTDAGDKIFYSWTETDTTSTGHHFNTYPDLYAKGYDIYSNTVTGKLPVIGTSATSPTIASQGIFWHYMSPKVMHVGGGVYEIPFTFTGDPAFGGTTPVDHYYVQGFQTSNSAFTFTALTLSSNYVSVASVGNNVYVSIYPNPTNNLTQLVVNLDKASDIKVEITNALGQVINTMNIKGEAGQHVINVDMSNENAGVYFCNVTTNTGKTSGKIIKQ